MNDLDILEMLKIDLEISTDRLDEKYLIPIIESAKKYIKLEGIKLNDTYDDGLIVEMYAAYLYRQRRGAGNNSEMPRMLRWTLNNRIYGDGKKNG